MNFIKKLEEKWGNFKEIDSYLEQKEIDFISKDARLNKLFKPLSEDFIIKNYKKNFNKEIDQQLLEFYKLTNGCRLMHDSLSIYGFRVNDDERTPFDIYLENLRTKGKLNLLDEVVLFGSLGGQYLLCFFKNEVVAINSNKGKIVKKYKDFNECFETIFNKLIDEYDLLGMKIHPNKKNKEYPILYHKTSDKKFL